MPFAVHNRDVGCGFSHILVGLRTDSGTTERLSLGIHRRQSFDYGPALAKAEEIVVRLNAGEPEQAVAAEMEAAGEAEAIVDDRDSFPRTAIAH